MDWTTFAVLLTGLLGVFLIGFGGWILLTRHAPRATRSAFRSVTEAAFYALCTGGALALFTLGQLLRMRDHNLPSAVAYGLAVLLGAVAVLKFRPRTNPRG